MDTPGAFVTGTGTGVGKSVVSASMVAALAEHGTRVAAFKPAVSGVDEPDSSWPADHELLATATGWQSPGAVAPHVFGPAVSPHLAADLAGEQIDPFELLEHVRRLAGEADALVCEGVGGLLVPLTDGFSVLDLMIALGLPAVVVAPPGLGTISDTRLTVDRLRDEGVQVAGVVLVPWPDDPGRIELSNQATLASALDVEVATLPFIDPTREQLARAGKGLPLGHWLGPGLATPA